MRKKLLIVSVIGLMLMIVIGLAWDREDSVLVAGEKQINNVKEKTKPLELDFKLFFDGEELPYNAADNTFYLPVDIDTSEWETGVFTGCFYQTESGTDEAQDDNGTETNAELLFYEDYRKLDKQQLVAAGEPVSFLAITTEGYEEFNILFTGLPMITFTGTEYLAEDGSQMFCLRVYDTDHTGQWMTECYTQARLRGNTSLTYEKKSLRLYLKNLQEDGTFVKQNENLLGMRNDDDWILNSLYADSSRIRDQLCVDLWNEVGATQNPYDRNFGTQSAMVEVMIGENYQGIYDLMVPIDRKQLGMDAVSEQIARNETVVERLYKKKYTALWSADDFLGALPDANLNNYRGGFYLKGDMVLENEEEWEPLYTIASLCEAEDDIFADNITKAADQQNLIDNWLFYQAVAGFDNLNKNYYYVARNRGDAYYGYFIPWDMNISFGAVYAENEFYAEDNAEVVTEMIPWQPAQRMIDLDVGDSVELTAATWQSWRNSTFSDEALTERIEQLEHRIKDSGAFAREQARWPQGNEQEDFSFLYEFALQRMQVVDDYIAQLLADAQE
jgi:hypothetical protein